jgi:hypothetical protein
MADQLFTQRERDSIAEWDRLQADLRAGKGVNEAVLTSAKQRADAALKAAQERLSTAETHAPMFNPRIRF